MKSLRYFCALSLLSVTANAETMAEWEHTAPLSDTQFTRWEANPDQPIATPGPEPEPAQSLYGYVDLSHLPTSDFPVRLRVLYSPISENDFDKEGNHERLGLARNTVPPQATLETVYQARTEAARVPIWAAPISPNYAGRSATNETVRLEVVGRDGARLARRFIGANAVRNTSRHAVLVHAADFNSSLQGSVFDQITNVGKLVPEDFAYAGVQTVWIDETVTADPALTDAFWRRVLLEGVIVAGHESEVQALSRRLGINSAAPALLGRFASCTSPSDLTSERNSQQNFSIDRANTSNPFYFSSHVGETMHAQLITFSRIYLGLFLFLQAALVIMAFVRLRGRRRVWLWLVIPLFAVFYALAGAGLARFFVSARAEARLEQIEQQHEGWPEALLFSDLREVRLDGVSGIMRLPFASQPCLPLTANNYSPWSATLFFQREADFSQLSVKPGPAREGRGQARTWIAAQPPCVIGSDGRLVAKRAFSGAWVWDGSAWRDTGKLAQGEAVVLAQAKSIDLKITDRNLDWVIYSDSEDFPSWLQPLLTKKTTDALTATGEGLFFGVQETPNDLLDDAASYRVKSRRVVAYQFHLAKGQP